MFLTQIYRAQNENSRLVHICGAPENSAKSGTYFGYPRRLIICTEQTGIYLRTFPNALTSKKAQNHEISIYFLTNSIVALCHTTS